MLLGHVFVYVPSIAVVGLRPKGETKGWCCFFIIVGSALVFVVVARQNQSRGIASLVVEEETFPYGNSLVIWFMYSGNERIRFSILKMYIVVFVVVEGIIVRYWWSYDQSYSWLCCCLCYYSFLRARQS